MSKAQTTKAKTDISAEKDLLQQDATAPEYASITAPAEGDTTAPAEGDTTATEQGHTTAPAEGDTTATEQGHTTAPAEGDTTAPAEGDTTAPAEDDTPAPDEGYIPAPEGSALPAQTEPEFSWSDLIAGVVDRLNGDFPLAAMKHGAVVSRRGWARGYSLRLGTKGNRGKTEPAFLMSGTRSGEIEWKPTSIADLLADDWFLVPVTAGEDPVA